jgi:hypothetical protein
MSAAPDIPDIDLLDCESINRMDAEPPGKASRAMSAAERQSSLLRAEDCLFIDRRFPARDKPIPCSHE